MLTRSQKRPQVVADARAHSFAVGADETRAGAGVPREQRISVYAFGTGAREHIVTIYDYEPCGVEFREGVCYRERGE